MWYSICIVYNASNSEVNLTINDYLLIHILDEKYMQNKPVNLSKEIILGGKGCNNGYGSFIGHLTDINAWDKPLKLEEVTNYNTGCNVEFSVESKPKAILWSQRNFTYCGKNTFEEYVSRDEICPLLGTSEKTKIKILSYKLTFQESYDLCSNLGGEMPTPTREHFTEMKNYNLSLYTECQKSYFWVPITKSKENSSVFVEANKEQNNVDFMPWGYGQPNGNILILHT